MLENIFSRFQKTKDLIYLDENIDGYWSNLSQDENSKLVKSLEVQGCRESIELLHPKLFNVIFSQERVAALELLHLKDTDSVVDFGCMWGALSIPIAGQVKEVLGIDQTLDSLIFSKKRSLEEDLNNINFLCSNLRKVDIPANCFNVAIVNGVLEWLPEMNNVVVKDYWVGGQSSSGNPNPRVVQLDFLKKINLGLIDGGKLFIAIENRYDYKMFCGVRDPLTGTFFTSIVTRTFANWLSKVQNGREYRNWTYSFNELKELLLEAGYSSIELYACWPDYRFPESINPYKKINKFFSPMNPEQDGKLSFRRLIANRIEWVLFKIFNLQFFAPSIIAIARK